MAINRRSRSASAPPRRSSRRSTLNPDGEEAEEQDEQVADHDQMDEEYTEDNLQLEDEEEEEELDLPVNEADDDEDFNDEDQPARKRQKVSSSDAPADIKGDLQGNLLDDEEEQHHADDPDTSLTTSVPVSRGPQQPKKARRGRPPLHRNREVEAVQEDLPEYEVVDDECVVPLDDEGETKVNKDGELLGGRQYKVRTFKMENRGSKLYMLSTEPARCVGFRDSYLLFQKHRRLHKIILTVEEKLDIIEKGIIPHSYKGRTIGLVAARSIFMEFGAKVVVGGKYITDDYYVKEQRESGVKEGELADPSDATNGSKDAFNTNQYVSWQGASSLYTHGNSAGAAQVSGAPVPDVMLLDSTSVESKSIRALRGLESAINEENWMYVHAQVTRDTDSYFLGDRNNNNRGVKDSYTGITFVNQNTQPTKVKYLKEQTAPAIDGGALSYKTVIHSNNLYKSTGLKDVHASIFEDCVSEDVKEAILRQQSLEKSSF
ncbi:hypothetical protein WICPIJ_007332 [Wickerhamomyces pijperi]|uniref:Chromatin structure-remodeling complex protein RSC7 n=1 Tax=Wickerhamomyces pijperi TaxID=599730 RepID=A0A9P8Q1W9_WICPI|nr:hypothetical protein WICPIJ_007332 [Wickerhamomyces pijperi]